MAQPLDPEEAHLKANAGHELEEQEGAGPILCRGVSLGQTSGRASLTLLGRAGKGWRHVGHGVSRQPGTMQGRMGLGALAEQDSQLSSAPALIGGHRFHAGHLSCQSRKVGTLEGVSQGCHEPRLMHSLPITHVPSNFTDEGQQRGSDSMMWPLIPRNQLCRAMGEQARKQVLRTVGCAELEPTHGGMASTLHHAFSRAGRTAGFLTIFQGPGFPGLVTGWGAP